MTGNRDRRTYRRENAEDDRYRRRRMKGQDNEDRLPYREKTRIYDGDRRHDPERRETHYDYDGREARRQRRSSTERRLSPSHDRRRQKVRATLSIGGSLPLQERRSKRDKSPRHEQRDSNKDKRQKRDKHKTKDDTVKKADFSADITPEDLQLMQAMGVPFVRTDDNIAFECRLSQGFQSTQGKHVEDEDANIGAIRTRSLRQARQFMNRKGGFNRPLPVERTGRRVVRD